MSFNIKAQIRFVSIIFLFSISLATQAQDWLTIPATSNGTKCETEVNLSLKEKAPLVTQPFLVKTGMKMNNGLENGLASKDEFPTLHAFSDSVEAVLRKKVTYSFVGNFTQNGIRINYFYVTDTMGLRKDFIEMYAQRYPTYNLALTMIYEKRWQTYFEFLFPGDKIVELLRSKKYDASR